MRELARKTGIGRLTLYDYEIGKTSPTMENIAKALGIKNADFYLED